MLRWILLAAVIVLPRYYLWGTAPAGIHGDEGGFSAVGMRMFAAPEALWSFGPQSLPNAHFWLYGAGIHLLGVSVWSARFVTSLFGLLQAFAIVDIARRTAGFWAALTAAIIMAVPLQLHFDRLAMCNVMTAATWSAALWCVVSFPRRAPAALAAGMLLALGWYGYQASRIVPLIAGVGLLPLLARSETRWPTIRLTAVGLVGFAIVIAPLAWGFYLYPEALLGRARSTSWLQQSNDLWPVLAAHLAATQRAILGHEWDATTFFPFHVPLIPAGIMGLALVGLLACRASALRACLAAWIALVVAGNVVRDALVYSPVLIYIVPPLALAASQAVRWLRWLAPLGVALVCALPIYRYFQLAAPVPATEAVPMAQAEFLLALDGARTVLIAGGVGCGHGLTRFALQGRTCLDPENVDAQTGAAQVFIVFADFFALEQTLSARADLVESRREWGGAPVHIWSSIPLPPEPS